MTLPAFQDVVKVGDEIEVKILRVDAADRKIGLSRKRLNSTKEETEGRHVDLSFVEPMDSYFRFLTTPNVEPTNNLAEQAIRFVAIHRRITQGTRGNAGQRWCERIWTVVATCAQQGRSVFAFLCQAVAANFGSDPAPRLQPNTS